MELKFWGTRGSIPVPGKNTLKYGGNTPCVQVSFSNGQIIIIDAGSGIREFGNELLQNISIKKISIFISHTHWDHIQGLPFFAPLFNSDFRIKIYSSKKKDDDISKIIEGQINNYFFPITSDFLQAKLSYKEIEEFEKIYFGEALIIPKKVRHSEGTFAYKLIENGKTIIYMTDNELDFSLAGTESDIDNESIFEKNKDLVEFCYGADFLIHDCMYEFEDYKKNWGHSNHLALATFSHIAKVKNLVLFHYDPDYNDDKIDHLLKITRNKLNQLNSEVQCIASHEGLII